jgi:thiol-disulfide isomerase/thioredoxin
MMRRAFMLVAGLLLVPALLHAQSTTPSGCVVDVSDWFNATYKMARDSAGLPGGKKVDVQGLVATRLQKWNACAAQFSVATTTGRELLALSSLYTQVGKDSLAAAAVDRRLAEPGLSEGDRATALVAMIRTFTKPDTLVIARAEPYMARLDALSNTVVMQKVDGHSALNNEYRYLDVNERIRYHSLAIINLTRNVRTVPLAVRDPDHVPSYTVLAAYNGLAEVYGDFGRADSALAILRQATVDHPEITAVDADNYLGSGLERYALVGQPAIPLEAPHWLNAAPDTKTLAAKGTVTVIEFTAHWCIPCRNSYPSMVAMADKFGTQGVQFVFATQFYGYVGAKRNLDPAAELAADEEYFGVEHGIHFPIAVADQPAPPKPNERHVPNPNDDRYKVGGIPQTVIIDKNGTIRRILTGWDTGNAQRLPALLTELLKEKPVRAMPQ